jgi:hypothetical protein
MNFDWLPFTPPLVPFFGPLILVVDDVSVDNKDAYDDFMSLKITSSNLLLVFIKVGCGCVMSKRKMYSE